MSLHRYPSASEYLKTKGIELIYSDDEKAVNDKVASKGDEAPVKSADENKISKKYVCYYTGAWFSEKPEFMTQIEGNKLAIWPKKNGVRKGDAIKIGPGNGLVGYPTFSPSGIMVMSAFNSDLRLGGKVEIDSSLEVAKGEWCIYKIIHTDTPYYCLAGFPLRLVLYPYFSNSNLRNRLIFLHLSWLFYKLTY